MLESYTTASTRPLLSHLALYDPDGKTIGHVADWSRMRPASNSLRDPAILQRAIPTSSTALAPISTGPFLSLEFCLDTDFVDRKEDLHLILHRIFASGAHSGLPAICRDSRYVIEFKLTSVAIRNLQITSKAAAWDGVSASSTTSALI